MDYNYVMGHFLPLPLLTPSHCRTSPFACARPFGLGSLGMDV